MRKTLTLGRGASMGKICLDTDLNEWQMRQGVSPRDLEKSPGRECKTSKASKGAAGLGWFQARIEPTV